MQLLEILGKPFESPEVRQFVESADASAEVSTQSRTRYLECKRLGVCFSAESPDLRICTIHVYCRPAEGYSAFTGGLPWGLQAGFDRRAVRSLLGRPSKSGELSASTYSEWTGPWDRWDFRPYTLHVQYSGVDGQADLVTLMLAGTA